MAKNVSVKETKKIKMHTAWVWNNPSDSDVEGYDYRFIVTCPWENKSTTGEAGLAYDTCLLYCNKEMALELLGKFADKGIDVHFNETKKQREAEGRKAEHIRIYDFLAISHYKEVHWQDKKKWNRIITERFTTFTLVKPNKVAYSKEVVEFIEKKNDYDLF